MGQKHLEWLVSAKKVSLELVLMEMTLPLEDWELDWETFSQLESPTDMEEILLLNNKSSLSVLSFWDLNYIPVTKGT